VDLDVTPCLLHRALRVFEEHPVHTCDLIISNDLILVRGQHSIKK
jgi:NAD-dependent oxidoreductase involved in siderophore biosynthesis